MNALVPVNGSPPMTVSDVERVALAIAKGGLFGSKDPNAVLTLCLLAQAEGQHPAVVFRDYHIISGKPAKKAEAMLRDFITAGGKVEWHQLDDTCADATFTHPSGSARIAWDHKRVQQAQLANNAMYKKYPRQMLRSRVISEGIRTVFPGATSGLYEESEVASFDDRPTMTEAPPPMVEMPAVEESIVEEAPAKKREKLSGPYTSKTALWAAVRQFDRTIRGMGDLDELIAFLETEEAVELIEQCKRDAPGLWSDGLPDLPEFVPLEMLIKQTRSDLEQAEFSNTRTVIDAG